MERKEGPAYDILIVGAGHAGAQTAAALRQRKFSGSVALVGDEVELPYERPTLSKEYLSGEKSFERILIRPANFYSDRDISLLLGRRAVAVDPIKHEVKLQDSSIVHYGQLIWATGGVPRQLSCSGHSLRGVHSVRTKVDVDSIIAELPGVKHAVIVGGGYVGLEVAAVLKKLGKSITLLEAANRVLGRVAGDEISQFYETEHLANGVDLRSGMSVECIEEAEGKAIAVHLTDGRRLACDMVIVGIGIVPAVQPLLAAGAAGGNGVAVDEFCRTSLSDIFAVGDCAEHANEFADGASIRLESVQNANDQAVIVAKMLTGSAERYHTVPWFWSNQYDLRLQTVGLSTGFDQTIMRGDPKTRSFSVLYLKKGRVIALDCVNATRDYVQGKALVIGRIKVDAVAASDTSVSLKELV